MRLFSNWPTDSESGPEQSTAACSRGAHPPERSDCLPAKAHRACEFSRRGLAQPWRVKAWRFKAGRLRGDLLAVRGRLVPLAGAALAWAWWVAADSGVLLAHLAFGGIGAALALIDARSHRLPDLLTIPLAVATAILLGCSALATGEAGQFHRALAGGAALVLSYVLLHMCNRRGLGLGDAKLAATCGQLAAWRGTPSLLLAAFLPFLLASIFALFLIASRRASRRTALAFGPFLLLGTALAISLFR